MPQYGLSGGGLRFDPGSLLIFSSEANNYYRIFSHSPSEELLAKHGFSERARYMHEFDHLLRHLSTSHGLIRHAIQSLMFSDVIQGAPAVEYRNSNGIQFPLEFRSNRVPSAVVAAGRDLSTLSKQTKTWQRIDKIVLRYLTRLELLRALDGDPPKYNAHLVDWGLAYLEAGLSGAFPRAVIPKTQYAIIWDEEAAELHPRVGNSRYSSKTIYEANGFETELLYAFKEGKTDAKSSTDLWATNMYLLAAALFDQRFRHRRRKDLMPLEFDAILDVALWIPYTLEGISIPKPIHNWTDIEPGWRFAKAIDWLENNVAEFHYAEDGMDFDSCDQAVLAFQEKLSAGLGWYSPSHLIDQWIEQLDSYLASDMTQVAYLYLDEGHPRLTWAVELLRMRKDKPFSFYRFEHKLLRESVGVQFPGGIFSNKDVAFSQGAFGKGAESSFWEYYAFTGSRFLFEGPIGHNMPRHHVLASLKFILNVAQPMLPNSKLLQARLDEVSRLVAAMPTDVPPYPRNRC